MPSKTCYICKEETVIIESTQNQQVQKQSEVFFKKRCSYKFHKIHRKTPVPESLFLNKVPGLRRYPIVCVAYFEQIFHEVFDWGFASFKLVATYCRGVVRTLSLQKQSYIFFKTVFYKNFVMFTGKHLRWSLFRPATLSKRDSNTGAFL